MSAVSDAAEGDDQRDGRDAQDDDAAREREAIAAEAELARHVAVAGEDRGQARERVERGVRGQEQDQRGERLVEVERIVLSP